MYIVKKRKRIGFNSRWQSDENEHFPPQTTTSLFIFPQLFKPNIVMRAKFKFLI